MRLSWFSVIISVVLTASCGSSDSITNKTVEPTTSATTQSPSASVTYTPAPEVLFPDGQVCYTKSYNDAVYGTYREAWGDKRDDCETEDYNIYYEPTAREVKAVNVAYGRTVGTDVIQSLVTLYDLCAQTGRKSWSTNALPYSKGQIKEVEGALMLCPDHPDKTLIEAGMAQGKQEAAWEREGRTFGSGTYRVGKDIQPGTYASPGAEGCYWERTDSSGNIIDNNFTAGATRVQVTILSSDYSFTSEGCGTWTPA